MSTLTAAELERSVENLRGILASLIADLDRLKADMALTEATVSHHKHDFTRDVTSQPTTYTPAAHNHNSSYSQLGHTHDYAATGHTHAYATSTHVHNYQDAQVAGQSADVSRTTGGPV